MCNWSKTINVIMLWMGLLAFSVQADDFSIKNKLKLALQFRIVIPSTRFDKTITLKPGEEINPIGTDLWHNAKVGIYAFDYGGYPICAVILTEKTMLEGGGFYLPQISRLSKHPLCKYDSNFPCDCFDSSSSFDCYESCLDLSNAQVVIFNEASDSAGHSELHRTVQHGQ